MRRGLKILIGAVIALVVLVVGGWIIYAKVINDPEDELTTADLDERLSDTTPDGSTPATTDPGAPVVTESPAPSATTDPAGSPTSDAPAATEPADTATADDIDGSWVTADGSEVGYRVDESLSGVDTEAVGRTTQVEGSLTIAGTQVTDAEFTVDVASITSDSSRRDGQFTGRIMETSTFPTATFALTDPIELGSVPAEGEQITAEATGDLTLHGVTKRVSFEVTAQQKNGKIGILGTVPVVFADYDIDNPSFGPVQTEDNGVLEILLIVEPA